ncbi:MAG: cytochrome-c peroxidase [Leptospiraceae bacterium]|nr:cytochrome-c peroxidase [Leptospiraceae bacterium]
MKSWLRDLALFAFYAAILTACIPLRETLGLPCAAFEFALPAGHRQPDQPQGVCITPERVTLGRHLFYSSKLSGNQKQSCSSCHQQQSAFADQQARSRGSTGQLHARNTPGLANTVFFDSLTWNNPALKRFDNQALIPFFSEDTPTTIEELAITGSEYQIIGRLTTDPVLAGLFARSFPGRDITITTAALALATFQTTLLSWRSPYDLNRQSEAARQGETLFRSERLNCVACHSGPDFNRSSASGLQEFANVGLYNVLGRGDYPDQALHGAAAGRASQGLFLVTGNPADRGKYRTPGLRNLAYTAPYMHDGSVQSLPELIEILQAGGRRITGGPLRGDGRLNPNKDPRIRPFTLSWQEKQQLLAFLLSLSDPCFVADPAFSDPSRPLPSMPTDCPLP